MNENTIGRRNFIKLSAMGFVAAAVAVQSIEVEAKLDTFKVLELGPEKQRGAYRAVGRNNNFTILGTMDDTGERSLGTFVSRDNKTFIELDIPDNTRGSSDYEVPREIVNLSNSESLILSDHVITKVDLKTGQCINVFDFNSKNDDTFDIQTGIRYGDQFILGGRSMTQGLMSADFNSILKAKGPDDVKWNWVGSLLDKVNPPNGLLIRAMCIDPVSGDLLVTAFDARGKYHDIDKHGYYQYSQRPSTGIVSLNKDLNITSNPYNNNSDDLGNIPISSLYPYNDGLIVANERTARDKDGKRTNEKLITIYDLNGNQIQGYQIDSLGLILAGQGNTVSIRGIQIVDNILYAIINGGNLVRADLSVLGSGGILKWEKIITHTSDGQKLNALGTSKSISSNGDTEILIGRYPTGEKLPKAVLLTFPKN